jgi:hypothetical protein
MTVDDPQTLAEHRQDADHDQGSPGRPPTSLLHPRVYLMIIGAATWFALAVWWFAAGGLTDYLLVIVCGFILVVIALQLILARVGRPRRDLQEQPLREWAAGEFDTWTGRLGGTQAATQILLPIAAAAIGMTAIGIVFYFAGNAGT